MPDFIGITEIKRKIDKVTVSAINSGYGTDYLEPLDILLSAKIHLIGAPTEIFTLTHKESGRTFTIEFDENTPKNPSNMSELLVPAIFGVWDIHIEYEGETADTSVTVDALGKSYKALYSIIGTTEVFETSVSTSYTAPLGLVGSFIVVGAGGGGAGGTSVADAKGYGGGGGGGACGVAGFLVAGETINITIGVGGKTVSMAPGSAGEATVITGAIAAIFSGGKGGGVGTKSSTSPYGVGGAAGGTGGGKGGNSAVSSDDTAAKGEDGAYGKAGEIFSISSTRKISGSGGGSYGNGGNGCDNYTSEPRTAGDKGGGGGGYCDGGDGYVAFFKGVVVN